jgi:8-oxo-dGTP diphosphatase
VSYEAKTPSYFLSLDKNIKEVSYCYEYPRPSVSADIAVFRKESAGLQVLLIKRKNQPYQGMWAMPGGFMEIDETLEQTAVRELEEETGLRNIELKQFGTFSQMNRDPRTRVVTTVYYGIAELENSAAIGGDDAELAEWFAVGNLPEMAFDHGKIIGMILNDKQVAAADVTVVKPS